MKKNKKIDEETNNINFVSKQNLDLKEKLLKKGYYVIQIGQQNIIDYLVVSCFKPLNEIRDKSN